MLDPEQQVLQQQIIAELGVKPTIDPQLELQQRVAFIKQYMQQAHARSLVIGISGGIDSLVVGCMAQRAVAQLRAQGYQAQFIALRLPYGIQADAADADAAIHHIQPDRCLHIDIKAATDQLAQTMATAGLQYSSEGSRDFVIGNIKARQRMVTCYAVAAAESGLVLGSDQAAEVLMGFFTKYGDGAADLMPLAGLNKQQVYALAKQLQVPAQLINKIPTADLESLTPLRPDEVAFGISYQEIDHFLIGQPVSAHAFQVIVQHFQKGKHKRCLPASPLNTNV